MGTEGVEPAEREGILPRTVMRTLLGVIALAIPVAVGVYAIVADRRAFLVLLLYPLLALAATGVISVVDWFTSHEPAYGASRRGTLTLRSQKIYFARSYSRRAEWIAVLGMLAISGVLYVLCYYATGSVIGQVQQRLSNLRAPLR